MPETRLQLQEIARRCDVSLERSRSRRTQKRTSVHTKRAVWLAAVVIVVLFALGSLLAIFIH